MPCPPVGASYKGAVKEIQELKLELENLEAITGAVHGFLKSSKANRQPLMASSPIAKAVKQCSEFIATVTKDLPAQDVKYPKRVLWAGKLKGRTCDIAQELNRFVNLFQLALRLDGWSLFFKSSSETADSLKEVCSDLQRVLDVIKPIEGMRDDLKEWEEHLHVIREVIVFCSKEADLPACNAAINRIDATLHEGERQRNQIKNEREKEALLDFVSPARLELKHRDISAMRHKNTGEWLIRREEFQAWLGEDSAPLLWGHGIPGCGKTVLFSTMVEYLKAIQAQRNMVSIAAYVTHNDTTLHQIDVISRAVLRSLAAASYTNDHLFVAASEGDLSLFLDDNVGDITADITQDESSTAHEGLRREIVQKVIQKSNGMFLLASFQVRQLWSAVSPREILERLDDIPEEVDAQYLAYFERIESQPRNKLALSAILWVSTACRPLQASELLEALATRPNNRDRDPAGQIALTMVIQAAGGLLVFDPNSMIVRLVHESLQSYIDRNSEKLFGSQHTTMLEILATYLNFRPFMDRRMQIPSYNWLKTELAKTSYKLLEYSCHHWGYHVRKPGIIATDSRLKPLPLADSSGFTPLHVAVLWKMPELAAIFLKATDDADVNAYSDASLTSLHVASVVDDVSCARLLIKADGDLSAPDRAGKPPLHIAATCGSNHVMDFFMMSTVGTPCFEQLRDRVDDQSRTPLHHALAGGHVDCATTLLKVGADPNIQSALGQTLGKVDAPMRALLQGLDPNLRDIERKAPLHVLAETKHPDIDAFSWLLKLGADLNSADEKGSTPLHLSLRSSNNNLTQHMLDQGARVDLVSKDGMLPISIAVGQYSCPRNILDRLFITEYNKGSEAEYLLHRAVARQNADEVYGLLSYGSGTTDRKNEKGETPLYMAVLLASGQTRHSTSNERRSDIVSLLLHKGASPHVMSFAGFTPLHIAVIKDSLPLLRQLLKFSDGGLRDSRNLPGGISTLAFAALYSEVACFELLVHTIQRSQEPVIDADALRVILEALLGNFSATDHHEIPRAYRRALNLPDIATASEWAAPFDDSDSSSIQKCTLHNSHGTSCSEFDELCQKIVLLAPCIGTDGRPLAQLPTVAPMFEKWRDICKADLKISSSSSGAVDEKDCNSHLTDDPTSSSSGCKRSRVFWTPCRHRAITALRALERPEGASNRVIRKVSAVANDDVWKDELPLTATATATSAQDIEVMETNFRQMSLAPLIMDRVRAGNNGARGLSIAGCGLSIKELSAYDKTRLSMLKRRWLSMKNCGGKE
ncbi:hypothetical protein DL767_005639 [Monosporascus sp. MG133]|nr:hypothetical protein DL767_005639 [Monosporascus sp. MG133]